MASFSLLLMTGDRPAQVVGCLTSLLWQLPVGTKVLLFDNGEMPVLECGMFRGIIELAGKARGWQVFYRFQVRGGLDTMKTEAVASLEGEGDDLLLWTDDDCIWGPGAVYALLGAIHTYRSVSPVVVDLLNRGYTDFTALEEVSLPQLIPHVHLYPEGTAPFEVEKFGGIFLCRTVDLRESGWSLVPRMSDAIATSRLPGPKAVVPAARVYHLPHTWSGGQVLEHLTPTLFFGGHMKPLDEGPPS